MQFSLIKKPKAINWSGNPIEYIFSFSPYGSVQAAQDIRLEVFIQVETGRNSNFFADCKRELLVPDKQGIVKIDISSITDGYLKYVIPDLDTLACKLCEGQSRKFKIKYRQYINNVPEASQQVTDAFVVCKGGLMYDGVMAIEGINSPSNSPFVPLTTLQQFQKEQPMFITFLYLGEAVLNTPSFYWRLSEDGDNWTYNSASFPFGLIKGDIFHMPLGKMAMSAPSDFYIKMRISFKNDADALISECEVDFKQRKHHTVADLLFVNSLGGLDALRLYGELSATNEYEQGIVQLSKTRRGEKDQYPRQLEETSASMKPTFSGNTGFVRKEDEEILQALYMNKMCFQVRGLRLMPVIISKKKLELKASMDFLYQAQIDWEESNVHRFYENLSLTDVPFGSCPALVSFTAVQESATMVRVNWVCPHPYHRVQVNVHQDSPVQNAISYCEGTEGTTLVSVNGYGSSITIEGRLNCGDITTLGGSVTPSLGPVTSVPLTLVANQPPVAMDDTADISSGYTTPQTLVINVLANDYDPEGEEIVAVVASGATFQGGWYSLAANGVVSYTPPSAGFSGMDRFIYKCKEAGGGGLQSNNATCYVNVIGGTVIDVVYAKLYFTNPITTHHDLTISDVFIRTYQNSLCTIPLDVSLMNIVFNYNRKDYTNDTISASTDLTATGAGTQTLIYSGVIQTLSGFNILRKIFTLMPGTGYIIV